MNFIFYSSIKTSTSTAIIVYIDIQGILKFLHKTLFFYFFFFRGGFELDSVVHFDFPQEFYDVDVLLEVGL